MPKNKTDSNTIGRVSVKLPIEFLTPIRIALSGDEDTDAEAIANGWRAYEEKLIAFAKHLVVPIDGPEDVIALQRTLAPVAKQFCGFQFRVVQRAGAGRKKSPGHYLSLAVAYAMERDKNPCLNKTTFAKMVAAAVANPGKKRVTRVMRALIDAKSRQIRNDNETLNAPALRRFAATTASLIQQQLTSDEIAQLLELEAQTIIDSLHKN